MFEPIGGTAPDHDRQGHDQPARGDRRRWRCCCASSASAQAAERVDRGIRAATAPDEEHARRRDGLHHDRGRRPRRRGRERRERRRARYAVELYDTTLRDGAQRPTCRTPSRTGCGSCTSSTRSAFPYIEGGWPGANPRDTEFFKLATKETLEHAQLTAFGMTRKAGSAREDVAGAPRPPRRRHRGRVPGRQVVGSPRHRGAAHRSRRGRRDGARLGRVPSRPGPARVLRRRALLRRVRERSGLRDDGARRGRGGGGRAPRPVRHERRDVAGRRRADRDRGQGTGERRARDPRAQRRGLRGRELARRGRRRCASRCRGRSTATASGPATPTSCRSRPTSCSRWA